MAFLTDNALDAGVQYLTDNAANLYICSGPPANYTQASSTLALGNKDGITVGAPTNGVSSGRRVVISAITDGDLTGNGTAAHWAITDGGSELLAWQALAAPQIVASGNPFELAAISITIPDPA